VAQAADELDFASPFCVDSDANGNAILTPTVDAGVAVNTDVLLECCLDVNGDDNCVDNLTAEFTVNITPFVPPVTSISCTAQVTTLGPDQDTVIDITTSGLVVGIGEVCVDIIIDSGAPNTASGIGTPGGACALIDANGNANIIFNGATTVVVEQDVTVRCFVDNISPDDNLFDPGEISDFEVITLDPAAGPAPVQVACSVFPPTVSPGEDSLVTLTLMNAVPATAVCFEYFSITSPPSDLTAGVETATLVGDSVCSTTNLASQAFANFESNPAIVGSAQISNIICCADIGANTGDCEPDDPQAITAVQVDPGQPLPFTVSIVSQGDNMPAADDTRDITFTTNPPLPDGTRLCLVKISDNTTEGDAQVCSTEDGCVDVTDPLPAAAANTVCDQIFNGLGTNTNNFEFVNEDMAASTQTISVVGCIDFDFSDTCEQLTEPISNIITFITP